MSIIQIVEVPANVLISLTIAANVTGVDPDYLAITAARESNFKLAAKAQRSSATGLFQFIDQTWLRVLARNGHKHGLAHLGRHIRVDSNGRHFVTKHRIKRQILNLRKDPTLAAIMAGRLTNQNARSFRTLKNRWPTYGELYIAHFLGVKKAVKLTTLAQRYPHAFANQFFPRAARANPAIFYHKGRARFVHEVYRNLVEKHRNIRVSYPDKPTPTKTRYATISGLLAATKVSSARPRRLR